MKLNKLCKKNEEVKTNENTTLTHTLSKDDYRKQLLSG